MNKKQRFYIILLIVFMMYFLYLIGSLLIEGKLFYPKSYGATIFLLVLNLAIIILVTLVFFLDKYSLYKKIGFFSINLHIVEAFLLALLLIGIAALGEVMVYNYTRPSEAQLNHFSIGIYLSDSNEPLNFSSKQVNNPVLTRSDISDINAEFIADPFLIMENDSFYLFFEVYNSITSTGDIGMAESTDGKNWSYKHIVLDESFHLSYPCVFTYDDEYYMIPEAVATHSIRLYKAHDFPNNWSFVKVLIDGKKFVDNTIFYYNDTWWLFTQTENDKSLHLFFSDSPFDNWNEHPDSPIISQDANISRPAGNVIVYNNRIFRFAQDDYPSYGSQVWGFEITTLTKDQYSEILIGETPILKGYENWNELGMHHISIAKIDAYWIAAVDGKGRP